SRPGAFVVKESFTAATVEGPWRTLVDSSLWEFVFYTAGAAEGQPRFQALPSESVRSPLPPTPSPKRRGGADFFLPLSASGRGLGGGVRQQTLSSPGGAAG